MDVVTIRGRKFKAVESSTMRHDLYVQGQIQKANLTRMELLPGESGDDFAQRVLRTACMNGDVLKLLGGLLMPADGDPEKWNEAMADDVADWLGACVDPRDKAIIRSHIVSALQVFISAGLVSLLSSQKSLVESLMHEPGPKTAA